MAITISHFGRKNINNEEYEQLKQCCETYPYVCVGKWLCRLLKSKDEFSLFAFATAGLIYNVLRTSFVLFEITFILFLL